VRARWPNGLQNQGAVYPHGYKTGIFKGDDKVGEWRGGKGKEGREEM
jgi:hypothetical protein